MVERMAVWSVLKMVAEKVAVWVVRWAAATAASLAATWEHQTVARTVA